MDKSDIALRKLNTSKQNLKVIEEVIDAAKKEVVEESIDEMIEGVEAKMAEDEAAMEERLYNDLKREGVVVLGFYYVGEEQEVEFE